MATRTYYKQPVYLQGRAGAILDYTITCKIVAETVISGKQTSVQVQGTEDFTDWGGFSAQARPLDDARSTIAKTASVRVQGPPQDGKLNLILAPIQTWDFSLLETYALRCDIHGMSPEGKRVFVVPVVISILPGSTWPSTPTIDDWTQLR